MPELPAAREELTESYEIQNDPIPGAHWRDECFSVLTSTYRRADLLLQHARTAPFVDGMAKIEDSTAEEEERSLARSWVRVSSISCDSQLISSLVTDNHSRQTSSPHKRLTTPSKPTDDSTSWARSASPTLYENLPPAGWCDISTRNDPRPVETTTSLRTS